MIRATKTFKQQLDLYGISQHQLSKASGIGLKTISGMCGSVSPDRVDYRDVQSYFERSGIKVAKAFATLSQTGMPWREAYTLLFEDAGIRTAKRKAEVEP